MYGYLLLIGIIAALWGGIWFLRRDLRRKMLVSSLVSAPLGLANPLFVPEYWDPIVVYRLFGIFDVESVLFSFFVGGVAATLYYAVTGRSQPETNPALPKIHVAFAVTLVPLTFVALAFAQRYGPLPAIVVLHICILVGITYTWVVRPDLVQVSLGSAVLFAPLYGVLLVGIELVVPAFVETQWSGYATFELHPFGVPLDEFIYATLFGAAWSVVYETGSSIQHGVRPPTDGGGD